MGRNMRDIVALFDLVAWMLEQRRLLRSTRPWLSCGWSPTMDVGD